MSEQAVLQCGYCPTTVTTQVEGALLREVMCPLCGYILAPVQREELPPPAPTSESR